MNLVQRPLWDTYTYYGMRTDRPIRFQTARLFNGINMEVNGCLLPWYFNGAPYDQFSLHPMNVDWFPFASSPQEFDTILLPMEKAMDQWDPNQYVEFVIDPVKNVVTLGGDTSAVNAYLYIINYRKDLIGNPDAYDIIGETGEIDEFYDTCKDSEEVLKYPVGTLDDSLYNLVEKFAYTVPAALQSVTPLTPFVPKLPGKIKEFPGYVNRGDWGDFGTSCPEVHEDEYSQVKNFLEDAYGYQLSDLVLNRRDGKFWYENPLLID